MTANYTIEKVDSTLTIKGNDPIDPGKETTSVQTNYTVGDVIEYKITVKNVSKDEATNVVVNRQHGGDSGQRQLHGER